MRAISLWQPWASAVAVGSKRFETRSWQFPKNLEGEVIAIHASKRWQRDEREWAEDLQELGFNLGFEAGSTPPLGAIVAAARLVRCFPTEQLYPSDFAPFADWDDPKQVEGGIRASEYQGVTLGNGLRFKDFTRQGSRGDSAVR